MHICAQLLARAVITALILVLSKEISNIHCMFLFVSGNVIRLHGLTDLMQVAWPILNTCSLQISLLLPDDNTVLVAGCTAATFTRLIASNM